MNRIEEGRKLWQEGKVKFITADEQGLLFEVEGSDGDVWSVEYDYNESAWKCNCPDFHGRHQSAEGSFICKHIWACMFELVELMRVGV